MDQAMSPEGETVLETERLVLRRWVVSDAAVQRRLWTERDPRVPPHRRISADGHPTVAQLEDRIRQDRPQPGWGLLVAVRKDDERVIGYCGLVPGAQGQDDEPELAYELLQAEWGRGFATEAAVAVVGWAQSSGRARLWAGIRDWNTASRRVAVKLGFVETGHVEPSTEYGDSLLYRKDL